MPPMVPQLTHLSPLKRIFFLGSQATESPKVRLGWASL